MDNTQEGIVILTGTNILRRSGLDTFRDQVCYGVADDLIPLFVGVSLTHGISQKTRLGISI